VQKQWEAPEMENKTYFSNIIQEYQDATEYNDELYQNIASKLNRLLSGKVIDFGNGGIINYDTQNLDKLICIDVIFKNNETTSAKIDYIYGDFYEVDFPHKANFILAQVLLHHLTDGSRLIRALKKATTMLEEDGRFIVVEVVFPRFLELLQNVCKPIIFKGLAMIKKPSLRFFSTKTLYKLLHDSGLRPISIEQISIGKKVCPAPALFPKLKIPGWLYPFKIVLIEAERLHGQGLNASCCQRITAYRSD
jgi:SAM-dependent methyltransferase